MLAGLVATTMVGDLLGCGGTPAPPQRGVLENDIGSWNYRRYQQLLDVEVWVVKNKAVAYTASYVRESAEREGQVGDRDVVSAFITRYESNKGLLRSLVKFVRRLAQDSGYDVEERSKGGVWLIWIAGNNEAWALWASNQHIVKLGGRGITDVPEDLIEAYGDRYPSRIREGLLDGPLPAGDDFGEPKDGDPEYDPDNPTPDWGVFETGDPDEATKKSQKKKGKGQPKKGKK